jgi:hypothetical protein
VGELEDVANVADFVSAKELLQVVLSSRRQGKQVSDLVQDRRLLTLGPYLFEPQVDLVSPAGSLPSKWSRGSLSYRLYINEAAFSLLSFGIRVVIPTLS